LKEVEPQVLERVFRHVSLMHGGYGNMCKLAAFEHQVKLISSQLAGLFVKNNKNDFMDAEAIYEAVSRPPCGS